MIEPTLMDLMLKIVENPVRRKIIKRLSQEPTYALELAREIGEAQQLVTSHLALMERDGFIGSNIESSPVGPKRKLYFLKQSACVTVSFGPHLYNEKIQSFEKLPATLPKTAVKFLDEIQKLKQSKSVYKIEQIYNLLAEIDQKISEIEEEKKILLCIRNLVMQQTSEKLKTQEKTHNEKRVLHFILNERSTDIEDISKALNLQESIIRSILELLKHELP